MLDKRSLSLLGYIDKECSGGGYKIFSVAELLASFPPEFGSDEEGVADCLRALSEKEYISVKYADEREVCLSPLPKGRLVFENKAEEETERARAEKRYFLYSFFGAIAGGAAVMLLAVTVFLLAGMI